MNDILRRKSLAPDFTVHLVQGDITQEEVDAIVNAANQQLQHGGGVAAAISRAGGAQIQQESDDWIEEHGSVTHPNPAFTTAGNLPSRYVIHAVGPRWGSGEEDRKLDDAVTGSLRLANDLDAQSLSLPALSTGIFGFPKKRAAKVILHAIASYAADHPQTGVEEVRLVLFDQPTVDAFTAVWDEELS